MIRLPDHDLHRNLTLLDVFTKTFQSMQEQLDFVLRYAIAMTLSQRGCIYLYNDSCKVVSLVSCAESDSCPISLDEQQVHYQLDQSGLLQDVVETAAPLVVNDFCANSAARERIPEGLPIPDRFLSVPVIINGRVVALIALADKSADYTSHDIDETNLLMSCAWQAVERRLAQDQLTLERNKYLQTLMSIGDGVMLVDRDGNVEMLNQVGQRLTGWSGDDAHGQHYTDVFQLSHDTPDQIIQDPVDAVFRTGQPQEIDMNAVLTARDGTRYFLEDSAAPILDENGKNAGVVLVFRDSTCKRAQRRKIEYLSFHDSLTGLYNRHFFEEELKRIDTARNWPIAIVMGDVNGLKLTNDVFGHAAGDELLKGVAAAMQRVCRSDDIIARWGGDEFILLLPKTPQDTAETIIARIKDEFAGHRFAGMRGSISMGVACKETASEDMALILSVAEERMYLAKAVEQDSLRRDMIDTIVARLHQANSREREHAEQVRDLCEQLGREIGLSEVEIRRVRDAGYLHDIGKVVLDPKLLNKNYVMTEEEWSEIKKHPIVGFRILNAFDNTVDLAEPILAHQEHWDGSGYPKGLKGEEIPLPARIIAMAEGYERLLHDSDNREAFTLAAAVAHIRSLAGSQYDPELAEVFARMVETAEEAGRLPSP